MPAIVLKGEEPHEKAAGGDRQEQDEPMPLGDAPDQRAAGREEEDQGRGELKQRTAVVGSAISLAVSRKLLCG
jgi:hypothetical protein